MYYCDPILLLVLFLGMIIVVAAPKRTDKNQTFH